MPIILWLLGVPLTVVVLLLLFHVIGRDHGFDFNRSSCSWVLPERSARFPSGTSSAADGMGFDLEPWLPYGWRPEPPSQLTSFR